MTTSLQLVEGQDQDQVVTDTNIRDVSPSPILNLETLSDNLRSGKVAPTDLVLLLNDPAVVEASLPVGQPAEIITTTSDAVTDFVIKLAPSVANDPVAFKTFLTANELTSSTELLPISSETDSTDSLSARIIRPKIHVIIGTNRNDILIGKATNDYIFGVDGNDVLVGGGGNDFLFGGNGRDILIGGTGNDALFGEDGDDTLINDVGNDVLIGGAGNDYFFVLDAKGSSLLDGGSGFDTANYSSLSQAITLKSTGIVTKGVGFGTDQLFQVEQIIATSSLNDWIDASDATSPTSVTVNLSTNSLIVNNIPGLGTLNFTVVNFENVTGTSQNDTITGNSGNNILNGGAGNDVFFGTKGNDSINGGTGTDTVNYSALGQTIVLGPTGTVTKAGGFGTDQLSSIEVITASTLLGDTINASTATGSASITANLATNSLIVNNVVIGGVATTLNRTVINFENVTGTSQNDSITGNSSNNILNGGAGNDVLFGSKGNDTLNGGTGTDTANYSALGQTIVLGPTGTVTKAGGFGTDQLNGIEVITASTLLGDTINASTATGSANITANLAINSLAVNNVVIGGVATTLNFTVNNFENVTGTSQNDIITGNSSNNTLSGGAGNDFLSGEAGNDVLIGGLGADILVGGTGSDRFTYFNAGEGGDFITDFASGIDKIVVSASGFGGGLAVGAISSFQFFVGASATNASQRFIYNSSTGGLFFDVDGFGGAGQQQIASLLAAPTLTFSDISVIA